MRPPTSKFLVYRPRLLGHDGDMSKDSMSFPSKFDLAGLSDAERILLAGELLDMVYSPMTPLTAEQIAELEQRNADADAGLVQGVSWESVNARLKRRG